MKLEIIIVYGIVIFLILFFLDFLKKPSTKYTNVKLGNTEIKAEIVDSLIERTKGLMFRKSLPEKEGMLFVFDDEGYHGFWMMNMSFPIDIIWISKEKKVIDIVKNAQPCGLICSTYKPKEKAKYVLEVNANFTEKHGIRIGSTLKFELNQ